jgi:fructokinase
VAVTLGDEGALFVSEGTREIVPAVKPELLVDTVGAGDAFSAALIVGILSAWPWRTSLRRAAALAGEICSKRGAMLEEPGFYNNIKKTWGLL